MNLKYLIPFAVSIIFTLSGCERTQPNQKTEQSVPDAPAQAPPLASDSEATLKSALEAPPEIKFSLICEPANGKGNNYYLVSMGSAASLLTSSPTDKPDLYREYALILEAESIEEYRYRSAGVSDEAKAYGGNPYTLNRQELILTSIGVGSLSGLRWRYNCQMAQDKVAILEMIKNKRNEYRAYKKQEDLESQRAEDQKKNNTKI